MPKNTPPDNKGQKRRTGKELADLVKGDWDSKVSGVGKSSTKGGPKVSVPNSGDTIAFTRLEALDNVVKVWVNGNESGDPDYVIVNPPVEVRDSSGGTVLDPLTAVAEAINGAN